MHDVVRERLGAFLDQPTAERVARELHQRGSASMILDLLEELQDASKKIAQVAVEAMPELQRRAGLADAVAWLDLGIALAGSSGAVAMKYFKESPLLLGVIEEVPARSQVLAISLDLADSDSNVALEFFRKAPELVTVLPLVEVPRWAEIGLELSRVDFVLGIEFLRQVPAVASVLPLDQVRSWVAFGTKLITQNSLGKTDYLGTMEFFRTSPMILSELGEREVRIEVVALGNTMAERSPPAAITFLAESPALVRRMPSPDWALRVLQYGHLVAGRDAETALVYLRRCPEVLSLVGDVAVAKERFEQWFKAGMEVLEYSPEGAQAYFALETKKALASLEEAMSGVPLRHIARSLTLFVEGLCGLDVSLESLPEPSGAEADGKGLRRATVSADGRTILLPSVLRHYPTREENLRLYTVMAAHEAGHLEFGTYGFNLDDLADLILAIQERYHHSPPISSAEHDASPSSSSPPKGEPGRAIPDREQQGEASVRSLEDLFYLYPQPALIKDLWTLLEDARVEYHLRREYPGLRTDLAILAKDTVTTRSLSHGMSVREMVVDALLLLCSDDPGTVPIPDAIAEVVERAWGVAKTLWRPDAKAEESVRVADRLYVYLEEMIEQRNAATEPDGASETPSGVGPSASDAVSRAYQPITNWGYRGMMNPNLITRRAASDGDAEMTQDQEQGTLPSSGLQPDRQGHVEEGQQGNLMEETRAASDSELEPVPDSRVDQFLAVQDERRGRHVEVPSADRTFSYDEWDGTIQDYRTRWCRVVEQTAPEGLSDFAGAVLTEHGAVVRLLRRYFEGIRPPGLRRMPAQADGEELDLDAIIRRRAEYVAGAEPTDRIYVRRERRERDVAVAFLVDLSGSTSRHIQEDGRRVIDVEKEGLVLLTEALEAVGDHYAVYGFSGQGRRHVDFVILKDFRESGRGRATNRIGSLEPRHQNRDGAAIRHAVRKVMEEPAKVRLLVLISDGKPLDDGYADEYSLEDTKMALREGRMRGVHPFCITVDAHADNYLRRMYGEVRYMIIDRVASLPERLPRIYQRLTA